jgi:hypothetical protein
MSLFYRKYNACFTLQGILPPNGVRYPRVGGRRERRFAGTSLKSRKLPENAATPTRRVHAVLGGFILLEAL